MKENSGHVTAAIMRRFFQGSLSEEDAKALVRHLLTQCPDCLEIAIATGTQQGFTFGS